MNFVKSVVAELIGLFVDDWSFALALLLWVGVCALPPLRLHPEADAGLLFAGLAALTLAFAGRQAAR